MVELADIERAETTIAGSVHRTPVVRSTVLGERIGAQLWLKAELFQKTGSFKPRGALNRLRNTPDSDLNRGLITVSAGNHAQGLAWAAREVGAPCTVVMPEDADATKADAARSYGAEVVLDGPVSVVFEHMYRLREERGLTFVHPFDDPLVIAGQGTVGLEIMEDVPDVSLVVVPVGGGGLISGVATAVKRLNADARVVAVEPVGAAGLHAAREAGEVVRLTKIDTFADGLSAPMVGELGLKIITEHVDELVLVSEEELFWGLEALMTRAKLYAEGAGAAATAALLAGKIHVDPNDVVVSIVSGGNIDLERLAGLASRFMGAGEG